MSGVHPAWLGGLGGGSGLGDDVVLTRDPLCGLEAEAYTIARSGGVTTVVAADEAGLMYGSFHALRLDGELAAQTHRPFVARRMVQHWDNVFVHPVMGQVERGYSGGSLFWEDGALTDDLDRVGDYARLLASVGINAVSLNNVNVHAGEARLLTDRLSEVAALAARFRQYHIRVYLSVSFAAPMVLGGLDTADPADERVKDWWATATQRVYATIPDFGGYVVKADSEGQPGPFAYGRTHADGANVLAAALAPFGGEVYWRAFVYNHRQDWRDRSTDRARAAYDHFTPLDGEFAANVVLQVKHGPIDFQPREPVSPVLLSMPRTSLAVEFQATQEYTGQQRHVCYLPPMWSSVLSTVAGAVDAVVTVSNAGDDRYWTNHPLAQANLYAAGRLAWDPALDPTALLDEWIGLTFPPAAAGVVHELMRDSWAVYEGYTSPLGVGFMVHPGDHYGPDVDGYEYSRWGTYHFADRDGVGVDRTRATGTGFTGQYPQPLADEHESLATCPDELLLFFHHVPYTHVLHSGKTVIQHIYDTHFQGAAAVAEMVGRWAALPPETVGEDLHARVADRLREQERSANEWRDQINTYFHRKSGIPDAQGRRIY
ncbi:alpha-glucuronidase [Dactylosporangium vinaceum]|uniref:Alpha-glucuronidase n=1 Tax=Dactylosporangium vinaceum TaxID=53362 RepID=A0ABV5MDV2_9ACTN|nr:alpha-glucuronidase [Dactylosporangium vinaceum]